MIADKANGRVGQADAEMIFGKGLIDEEVHVITSQNTIEIHSGNTFIGYLTVACKAILLPNVADVALDELLNLSAFLEYIVNTRFQPFHEELRHPNTDLVNHDFSSCFGLALPNSWRQCRL